MLYACRPLPLQAVASALLHGGRQLPPVLYRPPAADNATSGDEAALLGQGEWEAAFERAVLDRQAFEREASVAVGALV